MAAPDPAARRPAWRDWLDPILGAAVLAGLALRVAGLAHGLPHVYNPDEVSILSRALALGSGDLNPHNFLYPSLFFYVLAAVVGALAGSQVLAGQIASLGAFEARFWQDPTSVYLAARALVACAGVLTIVAAYRLALKVGDRTTARIAAILLAVAYVPVRDAHFVKHDVPATLLIVLAALASWRVWERGRPRDYALAGAAVGVAAAFHYYAVFAVVPLLAAHLLRPGSSWRTWLAEPIWVAAASAMAAFAVCSPFVLLDAGTAARDIAANRAIIVDRAQQTFGAFGSALVQFETLRTQAGGWLIFALCGLLAGRARWRTTAWLASFPLVFFLFIANTWPYSRTANPMYPFLAILAAAGIVAVARVFPRADLAVAVAATMLAGSQPVRLSVTAVSLFRQTDTRTLAERWIEANVPAGASVAVEPYSVQLAPTQAQLVEALARAGLTPERAGRRARALLGRSPYPVPAYRLFYLGDGGLDDDKIYLPPALFATGAAGVALRRVCVEYVVLKSAAPSGPNVLSAPLADAGGIVHRETPFLEPGLPHDGWLPDFDIAPSRAVTRPGPVIEVWRTPRLCGPVAVAP